MFKFLTMLVTFIMALLGRKPVAKPAREVLAEGSPTADAIAKGEAEAEERFGPRPE